MEEPQPVAHPFAYRVESILGAGAHGIVYRAIDGAGQAVALKLLRSTAVGASAERFAREAGVRIDHPHIVRVLDAGTDPEGTPFIAFELLEGESLADRLLRGPLDVRQAASIGAQICRGLAAAHERGIVHRDLKPANVFVTTDGTVKLLDFGIAHFAGGSSATVTGQVLGTPAYLSPEQAAGRTDIDARADVWAVGVLLWECLLGHSPFERGTSFPTLLAILMDEAPALGRRLPDVPEPLARAVDRCLARDRTARWPDAASLGAALAAVAESVDGGSAPVLRAADPGPLPAGEERVVAVLLARGVGDRGRVELAIRGRRGVPIAVLGDSVLGLFGAETWEGDEVQRAVGAALECRDAAEQVAVGSGRASAQRGALAGPAVRAAEDACRVSVLGVAVDDETGRAVRSRFVVEPVDETLYEVIAERGDEGPDLDDGATFVGRQLELARLREAVYAARQGQGPRVVLVTGPPGIGKTRLRVELERGLAAVSPSVRLLSGGAESTHRGHALSLWAALLLRAARRDAKARRGPRVDASAPTTERRQAVLRLAREALPDPGEARECADFLGELLDVPMPESPALLAARADPVLMADRLRLALLDLLAGLCARGPTVILLEDLHWADEASLRIVPALAERPGSGMLAIVATARTDGVAALAATLGGRGGVPVQRHELGELDAAEVATLARAVGGGTVPDSLTAALYARAGGNPLFVEETVRALHVRARAGGTGPDEPWPLPLTIEAAVQTRLDALSGDEREICRRAAVLGRAFRADEVVALGAPAHREPYESLRRGRVLELGGARAELRFAHALVGDICYRSMGPEIRQDLHRRAAELLQARPRPEPAEVARHHELGGASEPASRWWARAAADAARRGDSASALSSADHALRLGAPATCLFELHAIRADSCRFLGRSADTGDALAAALAVAGRAEDRARALTEQAAWLARSGHLEEARARSLEAVETARRGTDPDALVLALVRASEAATMSGRRVEALQALDEARRAGAESPQALAKIDAARALAAVATGDFGEALRAYTAVLIQNRAAGDRRRAAANEQNLADLWNRVGAYAEAELALGAALEDCRRVGNRMVEPYVLVNLAYALTRQGAWSDALETLRRAESLVAASTDARLRAALRHYRARALLDAARPSEARAELERAAAELAGARHPSWEVLVDTAVAACDLAEGRVEDAVTRSTAALRRRDELGALEEDEAEVFLVHARALEAAGRSTDAALVRARGRARVAEIAEHIEDDALRRRFLDDVPAHRALR